MPQVGWEQRKGKGRRSALVLVVSLAGGGIVIERSKVEKLVSVEIYSG